MTRTRFRFIGLLLVALIAATVLTPALAQAAPPAQEDDPVAQCAEGVHLFEEGRYIEALPLLEAGFAGREEATFGDPDSLGMCALALGTLRYNTGDRTGALEACIVALEVFQASGNRGYEGTTLHNIGEVYRGQGRYTEALEAYQQALILRQEVGDQAGEGTTLNNIGEIYRLQGHYAEALESFQQALMVRRKVGDRAGEGTTLNNTGLVYHAQGRHVAALEAFQRALATLREVGDRAGEGATLSNIGNVYRVQGRYAEALEAYQQALVILREVGDRASEGRTLNGIGGVYHNQGRYAEALEVYQQALAIRREVGHWAGEGTTLNNIGGVYYDQGHYGEALEAHLQALAIRREVGDRTNEGRTLNNIGGIYHAQGRYGEALEAFQQALAIWREVGDRAGEGATLNNIGLVYHTQGRYAEALEVYLQALAIWRKVGNRAGEGVTLTNISAVYSHQGRYAEALEVCQQALAISRKVGDQVNEGRTLNNMGIVYDAQGRYAEALEAHQQALAIVRKVGNRVGEGTTLHNIGATYDAQGRYVEALETFQQALEIQREVGDRAGEGMTLYYVGWVYQQQDKPGQALAHYEQAMDGLEALRAVAGSEAGRAGFIAQYADLYDRAVGLYHQEGQDTTALHTSERGRARAFLDSLATGRMQISDNEAIDLLDRERKAHATRQAAQDALAHARTLDPPDPTLVADLEARLAEAEAKHAAVLTAIEARGDQLAALAPGRSAALELPDVQALLDDQITLVSYYVLRDEGTLAFLLTPDTFSTIELPDATPDNLLTALVDLYDWRNLEEPHPSPLRDLHAWLVAPLADHLHTPLVGIIPHQTLHYVPFAALSDGETYFGEQHTLFTLPSASALPFIQDNAVTTSGTGALVLGNPETGDPNLGPLVHAAAEVETVAELMGVPVYIGIEASEARLRSHVTGVKVVHLAAHGDFNTVAPLFSAIHLAPGGDHDGRLEVQEVYGLDLNASDLVVLSACQSHVGELSAGDELVGLTRAFFFSGTPSVIASLWSVDDAATEELMIAFYRHWHAGMGKAEALQAAQAGIREKYPSPFYWAAFVLSGEPGAPPTSPMNTPSGSPWGRLWPWGIVGVAVVLVLLGMWSASRRWRTP